MNSALFPVSREDVTEIIHEHQESGNQRTAAKPMNLRPHIEFKGEGVVRASDIQADQDIEILNPDLVIAT